MRTPITNPLPSKTGERANYSQVPQDAAIDELVLPNGGEIVEATGDADSPTRNFRISEGAVLGKNPR